MGRGQSEGSRSELVLQFAKANATVRLDQIREALELTPEETGLVVGNLVQQGGLKRIGHALYQYMAPVRTPEMELKLWNAARINPTFSTIDLAQQAGTSRDYAAKRVRFWRNQGFVVQAGMSLSLGGTVIKQWRLTSEGRKTFHPPQTEVHRINPLVAMAVELNRLICTGRAARHEADREKACELCATISDFLEPKETETC